MSAIQGGSAVENATPIFMTPEQTADLLSVSVLWVYEKCRRRQRDPLPVLRIGRYLRFEKDAVILWARNRGNKAYSQTVARVGAR